MNTLLFFFIEHWAAISAVVAAVGLRLFPTEKNYDVFSKLLKLLDLIVPNLKKGGGRHITKVILFFALAFVCENSFAQLNTRTRQIRFATIFQASDTAATVANSGRVWFDFNTKRYRANYNGVNKFFGESGGGAFWALSGTSNLSGNVSINNSGINTLSLKGDGSTGNNIRISNTDDIIDEGRINVSFNAVDLWYGATPGSPSNRILINNTGLNLTTPGASYLLGSNTGTFTGKHTFTPTSTVSGINVGSVSGNLSSPTNGDIWYNNVLTSPMAYTNSRRNVSLMAYKYMTAQTIDFASTAAGAQTNFAFSFTNTATAKDCNVGDPVLVSPTSAPPNGIFIGRVSALNEITITYINTSTATVDPASLTFNIIVAHFYSGF